jgi:hypothetical protein
MMAWMPAPRPATQQGIDDRDECRTGSTPTVPVVSTLFAPVRAARIRVLLVPVKAQRLARSSLLSSSGRSGRTLDQDPFL